MKDAKTYREYAVDCIRIAQSMDPKDREILLKMAKAWEDRAREAEANGEEGVEQSVQRRRTPRQPVRMRNVAYWHFSDMAGRTDFAPYCGFANAMSIMGNRYRAMG